LIGLLPFVWSPALRHWRLSSYLWSFASKYLDLNSIVQILEVGLYSHTVIHSIIVYSPFGADCEPVEIPSNRAARLRLCCRRTWRILAVPKVFFLCFSMETNWIQLIIMAKFWEILCGDVFLGGIRHDSNFELRQMFHDMLHPRRVFCWLMNLHVKPSLEAHHTRSYHYDTPRCHHSIPIQSKYDDILFLQPILWSWPISVQS
jgi:hypothetical protein